MSRIGKLPINIPEGVSIDVNSDNLVTVKGKLGELKQQVNKDIEIKIEDKVINVINNGDTKQANAMHGLYRSLINNMVIGVKEGFKKGLEIVGTGYKAQLKGNTLVLQLGFSHPVEVNIPQDLKVTVEGQNKIFVEGIDKQRVGQFAASIRAIFPPEPYKGKGIRYIGEEIRRKLGKAMAK